jgi:hypothetical protein
VKRLILSLAMLALPLAAQAQDQQIDASAIYSSGDLTLAPAGDDIMPSAGGTINLGSLTTKFGALHASELWVETLVAQDTMATIGGRVLVAPTTSLVADLTTSATTIHVKNNTLAGHKVALEANGEVEWMAVTSSASGSTGNYTYTVTRDLDGSGANAWPSGTAVLDTGTTGDGYIDLYSVNGLIPGSTDGPTIVGNVRTGTTWNNIAPRWAIGNLDGLYGYSTTTYGAAFGDPDGSWLKVDATNGVRMGYGSNDYLTLSTDGAARLALTTNQSSTTAGLVFRRDARSGFSFGSADRVGVSLTDYTGDETLSLSNIVDGTGDTLPTVRSIINIGASGWNSAGSGSAVAGSSLALQSDPSTIRAILSAGTVTLTMLQGSDTTITGWFDAASGFSINGTHGLTRNCNGTTNPFQFTGGIVTTCTAFSDLRKKHDVEPFTRGLADVLKIRPIAFTYNADVGVGNGRRYGFSGQNLMTAIPEAMTTDEDGFFQISYDAPILAAYANAIRELAAQVDELKWEMEHAR